MTVERESLLSKIRAAGEDYGGRLHRGGGNGGARQGASYDRRL